MHRNLLYSSLVTTLFLFSSCFEITEEFTLNENGSGEYSMKLDMYKMMEMISSIGGGQEMNNDSGLNSIKDTTIHFRDAIEKSDEMTAEEKKLFRNGNMQMKMHLKEKDFYFRFLFPYQNFNDLSKIYRLTPKAMSSIDYKTLNESSSGSSGDKAPPEPSSEMAASNAYFELENSNGVFARKFKRDEWKNYSEKDSSFLQMNELMNGMYLTSVIHFPRPVKICNNPLAKISEDRKTVTFKFSFSDYSERPEALDFRIEY